MTIPTGPLVPYRSDLALTLREASTRAGRSDNTVRAWCMAHGLGRKIGHAWAIDAAALELFLAGQNDALERYLSGDREHPAIVRTFEFLGVPIAPPPPLTRNPAQHRRSACHAVA